jgi:hypothetical protein
VDLPFASIGFLNRRIEHYDRSPPDIPTGAIAFNKWDYRVVGNL